MMANYYRKKNRLQKEDQYFFDYYLKQNYTHPPSYPFRVKEFSQKEKENIFYNSYSCIHKFYQFVDDLLQK